jgi:biotin/methionine sulfoxide reductase
MKNVKETSGNQAIFGGSYGWGSAGRMHHAQSQIHRFLNCTGGYVRSEGNYSYNAALILFPHIVGNFREHVKEATRWSSVEKNTELVLMFGGIPIRNTQVGGGGLAKHQLRDELLACKKAGVEFINFSPLRSDAMDELDAHWHSVIPGSDTAIMMGLAHTLLIHNLHDVAFLERYTVGFSKFEAYLTGKEDGIVKDAAWASLQSGMAADSIHNLALRMASSRTLICTAVSLQRAESGEQPLWMTVTLAAMVGQIGLPGGGYGVGYGGDAAIGSTGRPFSWGSFPQGKNLVNECIPVACISDMLLHPNSDYEYNGQVRKYPDISMVWWAGGNPFHHHQDLNRLVHAFQQPETIIVNEIYWTATAKHADIVLPVTSTLERTDFGAGTQDNFLIPMPKLIEPVGESRDEYDIYADLAARLDCEEAFTQGLTSKGWLEKIWSTTCDSAAKNGVQLPKLDDFLQGDCIELENPSLEHVFLADFRDDPEVNKLPTPSGKIEIFSEVIAQFDYQDCPGHASWLPPTEWLGSDKAKSFPIHLVSGQPGTRLHSQLDSGSYSKSHKIKDREPVLLHPKDAKARGISDGDIVRLFNERGSCLAGARITENVRENVVFLWTGAWFDPEQPGKIGAMDKHGNPNMLTHDRRTSRLSQGTAAHSALINIEKFKGHLQSVTAYEPPL